MDGRRVLHFRSLPGHMGHATDTSVEKGVLPLNRLTLCPNLWNGAHARFCNDWFENNF